MKEKILLYTIAATVLMCAAFIRVFSSQASVKVMSGICSENSYGVTLSDLAETCFAKSSFCD